VLWAAGLHRVCSPQVAVELAVQAAKSASVKPVELVPASDTCPESCAEVVVPLSCVVVVVVPVLELLHATSAPVAESVPTERTIRAIRKCMGTSLCKVSHVSPRT
jgi:hypothetical protein